MSYLETLGYIDDLKYLGIHATCRYGESWSCSTVDSDFGPMATLFFSLSAHLAVTSHSVMLACGPTHVHFWVLLDCQWHVSMLPCARINKWNKHSLITYVLHKFGGAETVLHAMFFIQASLTLWLEMQASSLFLLHTQDIVISHYSD